MIGDIHMAFTRIRSCIVVLKHGVNLAGAIATAMALRGVREGGALAMSYNSMTWH